MLENARSFALAPLLFACGSNVPCPPQTCPTILVVQVSDASGNAVTEFTATAVLDGTTITVNCVTPTDPTKTKDGRCTSYGFALEGEPQSVDIKVTSGTKSGETKDTPSYGAQQHSDCNECLTATETVTVR